MKRVSNHISVSLDDAAQYPESVRVSSVEGGPETLLELAWECLTLWASWKGISPVGAFKEAKEYSPNKKE